MATYIKLKITDKTNMELAQSARLMVSADYKERFIAEYLQVSNRLAGLKRILAAWDDPQIVLGFTPTCPRATYNFQVKAMQEYKDILEVRAKIEGIDLYSITISATAGVYDVYEEQAPVEDIPPEV